MNPFGYSAFKHVKQMMVFDTRQAQPHSKSVHASMLLAKKLYAKYNKILQMSM